MSVNVYVSCWCVVRLVCACKISHVGLLLLANVFVKLGCRHGVAFTCLSSVEGDSMIGSVSGAGTREDVMSRLCAQLAQVLRHESCWIAMSHPPPPPPPRVEPKPPPGPPPNASAPSRGNDPQNASVPSRGNNPPNASALSRGNGEAPCCESDCSQTGSATRKARV